MNGSAAPSELDAVALSSLLCSRLCHDLLSPIGALANGLELLADETDPEMRRRCFGLLEDSARASSDKLRFFRLAFGGSADPSAEAVPLGDVRDALARLAGPGDRIALNWAIADAALPGPAIKVLLNLALIGLESLVRGGTLDVGAESQDGSTEIVVRASGERIAFDPALGQALDGALAPSDLSSRTVAAALLHRLTRGAGGELQYAVSDDSLVLGAMLPGG